MAERRLKIYLKTLVGSATVVVLAACGAGPKPKAVDGKSSSDDVPPKAPLIQSVTDGSNTYFVSNGGTLSLDSGEGQVTIEGSVETTVDNVTSDDLVGTVDFNANTHLFSLKTTLLFGETRLIKFTAHSGSAKDENGALITIAYMPIIKLPLLSLTSITNDKVATGDTTKTLRHFSATTTGVLMGMPSVGATGYQIYTGPTMLLMGASQ